MELTTQQSDRAAGVLLATAAGDALGAGYEFAHLSADAAIGMTGGGSLNWAPGEWTDDTAMAIAIAEVAATGTDIGHGAGLDGVAAQFVRWFESNPAGIGKQTRAVLSQRSGSADAMTARARAITGRKGGNGSLMRTAPVALAYLDNPEQCIDAAARIASLTHDDERAVQACQLWTYAIRHAVLHGTFDGVRGYLSIAPADVAEFWGSLLDQAEHGSPTDFANNGWVVHALQTAWWAITTTDGSDARHLQLALEAAVRAGGDTDTTAAIAGGLLGARWGASAVPARWRRILHGWPGYTATDLVRLAVKTATGGADDDVVDMRSDEVGQNSSDALEIAPSTTLVEVTPGVAVVFGEVPEGLELISLDLVPSFDRTQLSTALGSLGNVGTIVGNVAEAAASVQGLYRVNDATLSLLKGGGQMASKDGAQLGAIFQNGKLLGQARFIPVSMSAAAAVAAIGPAVAMIALQMQLGEISGLVRTNIALTTQTLKAIRNEQWAELEGLAEAVDEAIKEARALDTVTDSVWEPIASSRPMIHKELKLNRKNVAGHIQEIQKLDGRAHRHYLESNAEAIVFDTHALLSSLKTHAQYQAIRAALARTRSTNDESEAQLADLIARNLPAEIDESLREIRQLTASLVRELRIIAELPGRATAPLTRKRKDTKASRLTCKQLLDAIEPLANKLHPAVEMPSLPETVCAPEGLDLDPYLHVLRWFLGDGETLRSVAFPYEAGPHNLTGVVPPILAKRVDATWDALAPGKKTGAVVEKLTSSTFVAVTNRRIVTAIPKTLLRRGELGSIYPLDEVRYVRPRSNHGAGVRPTVGIATDRRDVQWMFPAEADPEHIDNLAAVISDGASVTTRTPAAIDESAAQGTTVGS